MLTPGPYELVLLTLGGFRLVRLVGWDTITEPVRTKLTGFTDEDEHVGDQPPREKLNAFVRCPWCVGFWMMLGIYGLWLLFPRAVVAVMVPLTLSALVGLIAKNLDP